MKNLLQRTHFSLFSYLDITCLLKDGWRRAIQAAHKASSDSTVFWDDGCLKPRAMMRCKIPDVTSTRKSWLLILTSATPASPAMKGLLQNHFSGHKGALIIGILMVVFCQKLQGIICTTK